MNNSKGCLKVLILIFLLCIVPRIILTGIILSRNNGVPSSLMHPDAKRYYNAAVELAKDNNTDKNWDVPLYPIFLSFFFKMAGPSAQLAIFLNIFLFAFAVCILYKIGAVLYGNNTGVIAGIIFSFYPSAFIYSLSPIAEPLFLLLFLSAIYCFVSFLLQGKRRDLIFAGILISLSVLTKEITVFFPLIITVLIFLKYRDKLKEAIKNVCVFMTVYIIIIVPYIVHNHNIYGHYTLSCKTAAYTDFLKRKLVIDKGGAVNEELMKPGASSYIVDSPFSKAINYFKERKHFFCGTGTVIFIEALGYDAREIKSILKNSINTITPLQVFKILRKIGYGWLIFQAFAWFFIISVYIFSFFALFILVARKKNMEAIFFLSILFYFIIGYSYSYTTRYFMSIAPFLSILSAYFFSIIKDINFKKVNNNHAIK